MKKRNIGILEVSEIGLGCMGFSHGYGKIPDKKYSIEAIAQALDYGCNFLDTAEVYGPNLLPENIGHNEKILGNSIKGRRNSLTLATKFFLHNEEVQNNSIYHVIKSHLEASLKRLGTDYIDLYYLHRINPQIPVEEIALSLSRLIDEGLVRGYGLSQVGADTIRRANAVAKLTAVQNLYNMFERDIETEVIPFCMENNIGIVAFSPTSSGLLSGKITKETIFGKEDDVRNFVPQLKKGNLEANKPVIDFIIDFAAKKNIAPVQLSLAWMIKKYPNVVPIPGSKNKERIIQNLKTSEVQLTDEDVSRIDSQLAKFSIYGHRGFEEDINTKFIKN